MEVFPHTSLWMVFGWDERQTLWGYTLLVGALEESAIDLDLMQRRLAAPEVRADVEPLQMDTPEKILRHFVCGPATLRAWTEGFPVNTDDLPLTQYWTRWSGGPPSSYQMFAAIQENPWPYLANVDALPDAAGLRERLDAHLEAQRLGMDGDWKAANLVLPNDPKFKVNLVNLLKGRQWRQAYVDRFGRPPVGLPGSPADAEPSE